MEKRYGSEALMVSHQSAQDLFEMGVISADEMRKYDEMCLIQEPETAKEAEKPLRKEQFTV
jgi:DNA-binding transcriptional regulator YiaG